GVLSRLATLLLVCFAMSFSCAFFFFLMRPPPPISTLFPYTTLFRSPWLPGPPCWSSRRPRSRCTSSDGDDNSGSSPRWSRGGTRSEEHTSELQSPYDLVCRLLLEKKNTEQSHRPESTGLTAGLLSIL